MIAIVSHDAGGAEILSSWLRHNEEPFCLVLDGPAIAIFKRKLGQCHMMYLNEAINQSDWVLCGTSWQSNLERMAIVQARALGKKVIAFLDHWVCYEERFLEKGAAVYPDEIWVGDVEANSIAQAQFSDIPVVLKSNPFFEDLEIELEGVKPYMGNSSQCDFLYVCEPLSEQALLQYGDERYWGYTEEDALEFFLNNINAIDEIVGKIKIRPHPSENKNKYDWAKNDSSLNIEIGGNKTLLEEIAESNVVIGCESMAMVVGMLAKKRVISSIPPGGKVCSLPQVGIEHLQEIIANKSTHSHA